MEEARPKINFKRVQLEQIFFKDSLCEEFRSSRYPIPNNIRLRRNLAIILAFCELICCTLGLGLYIRRRSRLIIGLIVYCFVVTVFGFRAKVELNYCKLLAHACMSIPVIGGFYIYIMIDNAITSSNHNEGALSETFILLLTSSPFLGLLIMGCYSCALCILVDEELASRAQA